jgi:activating signal cointegrator 1
MRAISLWQPWASLIAEGKKKIETRNWGTGYRGLVAIHAAKHRESLVDYPLEFVSRVRQALPGYRSAVEYPRGCFIAVGRLHLCLSTTASWSAIPARDTDEWWFGNYEPNRFMWVFDEIWKLKEPVVARGYQRLWTLDEATQAWVMAMLPDEAVEKIKGAA